MKAMKTLLHKSNALKSPGHTSTAHKRMLKTTLVGALALPALFSAALVQASDKPPADALPLSEIISMLEAKGYQPVLEASFDDDSLFIDNDVSDNGVWEIEAIKEGYKRELKVDPLEGVILSDELDD